MDKELSIPQVEIIENGKPVSQERMDPAIMTFIMQSVAAVNAVKLRKLEESKIPIGTKSLKYTVTDTVMKIKLSPPWISLSMINDGESDVYISTNEGGEHDLLDQVPVEKNETFNLNMDFPVLNIIWLRAADNGSASIRIHGKEGRRL